MKPANQLKTGDVILHPLGSGTITTMYKPLTNPNKISAILHTGQVIHLNKSDQVRIGNPDLGFFTRSSR